MITWLSDWLNVLVRWLNADDVICGLHSGSDTNSLDFKPASAFAARLPVAFVVAVVGSNMIIGGY